MGDHRYTNTTMQTSHRVCKKCHLEILANSSRKEVYTVLQGKALVLGLQQLVRVLLELDLVREGLEPVTATLYPVVSYMYN